MLMYNACPTAAQALWYVISWVMSLSQPSSVCDSGGTQLSCPQGMPGYSHYSLSGRNTSDSGSSASGTSGSGSSGRGSSADTVVPSRGYNVGPRLNPSCALNLNCSQGACDYCEALRDLSEGNNVDHEPTTPKRNRDGAHPSSRNDMDLLPDLAQLYLSVGESSVFSSFCHFYQKRFDWSMTTTPFPLIVSNFSWHLILIPPLKF